MPLWVYDVPLVYNMDYTTARPFTTHRSLDPVDVHPQSRSAGHELLLLSWAATSPSGARGRRRYR